ncbi:MAG: molybdate ABC transporter substrate-binding protein, partial [Crocinitomicaceae bacterium]|nr:molybdate ABC transporter substrate-binding protein [Crocinitomicaceae bacterium]
MRKRRYWLVVAILFFAADIRAQQNEKILIAAASDMKFALDSVIKVFNLSHKGAVGVTYSASGKLFEQISNGAPFDLFFSADISFPENLREKGFALSEVHTYGVGRVVIWSKKIDPSKEGIKTLLQPGIKKIAIANPQHAPYGRRAEEALKYYGVYDQVKERLVLGEN